MGMIFKVHVFSGTVPCVHVLCSLYSLVLGKKLPKGIRTVVFIFGTVILNKKITIIMLDCFVEEKCIWA